MITRLPACLPNAFGPACLCLWWSPSSAGMCLFLLYGPLMELPLLCRLLNLLGVLMWLAANLNCLYYLSPPLRRWADAEGSYLLCLSEAHTLTRCFFLPSPATTRRQQQQQQQPAVAAQRPKPIPLSP